MPISESSPRHLLTVAEAAELLNVSTSTVRRRIWDGELLAVRLGSGPQPPVRVDPNELEAFIFGLSPILLDRWDDPSSVPPEEGR